MFKVIITQHRPNDGFFIRFSIEEESIPSQDNILDFLNNQLTYTFENIEFSYNPDFEIEVEDDVYKYIANIVNYLSTYSIIYNNEFSEDNIQPHSRPFWHHVIPLDNQTILTFDFFKE